jgi:hypothetical protein
MVWTLAVVSRVPHFAVKRTFEGNA